MNALLARSSLLLRIGHRTSLGSADGSHFPAISASAEESIAAIGLETRYRRSGRHNELFENFSGLRIDAPQFALVALPGAVPQLAVDPGDAGYEAIGFDRPKDRSRLRIDLMDLLVPILPDPERAFGPCEPRVTTAPGRRDRREHTAGPRID